MKEVYTIDSIIEMVGLPENYSRAKLIELIRKKHLSEDRLSLEDLRNITSDFLLDLILDEAETAS